MTRILSLALVASLFVAPVVCAEQIPFNASWKEQKFSLFSKNKYSFKGGTLGVQSNGSVSMAYTVVPENLWASDTAAWRWSVEQTVPATDLRQKGGEDRNLAMYAVFLPEEEAQRLKGAKIRKLLKSDAVRVLVYVWGGNNGRGKVLSNPYLGDRGKTIVLRDAGTGSHAENVDFARDFQRAFGGAKGAFVGIAVSADSDDTDSRVQASISNLLVN